MDLGVNMTMAVREAARLQLRNRSTNLLHLLQSSGPLVEFSDKQLKPQLGQFLQKSRFFSSEPISSSDFLCSNKARLRLRDFEVGTQDFQHLDDGPDKSPQLERFLQAAQDAADKKYNKEVLKELYYRLVRPELVSRLLIHNHPFDHSFTRWLKYQTHVRTKATPRFTTCYDVMCELICLPLQDWVFFLNYLAEERIAVVEEWISISSTLHLMYDHGLKDFGGMHFHKGESDASWHQQSSTADLSTLIWDDQQVISSNTDIGVSNCHSITNSEGKAALALLMRAKDMGLEHLVLWTGNKKIGEIVSGQRHVDENDKDWKLYMALRSMRASFKHLVVLSVPREMMKFTDGMLREPSVQHAKKTKPKYPRFAMQSAKQWAYHLNALPVFRLSMTAQATGIMNSFDKPADGEPFK